MGKLSSIPEKTSKDKTIAEILFPILQPFSQILLYSALPNEPELSTLPFLLKSIEFYYPKVNSETRRLEFILPQRFVRGSFGILEPEGTEIIQAEELERIILPSLGFSPTGHRLGRGGGYYDRTLQGISPEKLIGVSYSEFSSIDFFTESHDIKVGTIVTETGSFFLLDENKSPDII